MIDVDAEYKQSGCKQSVYDQYDMANIAEIAVMGAVLLAPEAIDKLQLSGSQFIDPAKGQAFELLRNMRDAGRAVDGVSFALETKQIKYSTGSLFDALGGAAEIGKWANTAVVSQTVYYAEQVERWYRVRDLRRRLTENLCAVDAIDADPQAIARKLEAFLQPAIQSTEGDDLNYQEMATEALDESLSEDTHQNIVPFGYVDLDARMGGLYASEMTILAARPSVGKSALGFGVALNAAKAGYRVRFLSCEMSRQQLGHRLLSIETSIPVHRIRNGYLTPEEKVRLRHAAQVTLPITGRAWIAPRPTVQAIRARCRIDKAGEGLDLLVVDYLGLLKATSRGKLYEQVTELTADLKALATELEIPVLVMCQLNREAGKTDEKPRLEHLRDSGSIEQDANNVVFIHRKRGETSAEIIIAKQRQGEVQSFDMRFNPDRCCFEDVDPLPVDPQFTNDDGGDYRQTDFDQHSGVGF